jgi:ssrA-binding protein
LCVAKRTGKTEKESINYFRHYLKWRAGKLEGIKLIANNKKAYFDYFILESYEAGIELFGTEVKSIRTGHCSVKEAWIRIEKNEIYIMGMHVNPYEKGNIFNKDPLRVRKLLMHKNEIKKIGAKLQEKGLTLVPLKVYFRGSLVKVEVGLARGKKNYDKRDTIAKKEQKREMDRALKKNLKKMD